MKKLFELKNVTKLFFSGKGVRKIDLDIFDRDTICLIGENGAGKTTLLKLITKATVTLDGEILYDKSVFHEKKINFLFQEDDFPINIKVKRVLDIIKSNEKDSDFYNYLYQELELEEILENKLFQLSGGEKQKLLLFQVLVSKPEILILDEYSNNIDVPTFKKLKKILLDYVEDNGVTLIMSSHKKQEMENSCQKIIVLKNGLLVNKFENQEKFTLKELDKIIKNSRIEDLE